MPREYEAYLWAPEEWELYIKEVPPEPTAEPYLWAPEKWEQYIKEIPTVPAEVAEISAAKPFPWKWVIFGGIGLVVFYSLVKKK
jgi:hypothetical protein